MDSVFKNDSGQPAYVQLYNYFRTLIISGSIKSGSKLPSIRGCAAHYGVSKTTVESAYVMLETEGCIYSVPQSGFYVADMPEFHAHSNVVSNRNLGHSEKSEPIYDFTSSAADEESFDFNLWQRYIKSALRTGARLLNYGDPQGEEDLRKALCSYVLKSRGIICNESQIVIGAGVQNLIQLLCSLDKNAQAVAFTGQPYPKGERIFSDYSREIIRLGGYDIPDLPDKKIGMIYTCPSHINYMGDVLPVSKRIDLLKYAAANDCLIIEDDFDSEFSYSGRPVPSLQSLDGGSNVVYIGTFSRLLLPSIRISFLVLTPTLAEKYAEIKHLYNQTASKTEQIALCRYISDGHLSSRIKKTKRLYLDKTKRFYNILKSECGDDVDVTLSQSGFFVSVLIKGVSPFDAGCGAEHTHLKIRFPEQERPDGCTAVFSVSSISQNEIVNSAKRVIDFIKKL